MYSQIAASSLPTVDTKYPRAQKCCPTEFLFRAICAHILKTGGGAAVGTMRLGKIAEWRSSLSGRCGSENRRLTDTAALFPISMPVTKAGCPTPLELAEKCENPCHAERSAPRFSTPARENRACRGPRLGGRSRSTPIDPSSIGAPFGFAQGRLSTRGKTGRSLRVTRFSASTLVVRASCNPRYAPTNRSAAKILQGAYLGHQPAMVFGEIRKAPAIRAVAKP
jgi:hypothetical protein